MTDMRPNRRRYFRIDDRVRLSYRPSEGPHALDGHFDAVKLSDQEMLQQLDAELNTLINTLWQDQPVAAQALGLINRKLGIITTSIDLSPGDLSATGSRETEVNISGCGMAFNCEENFPEGQLLDLQITLLPSETVLCLLGRVEACESSGDPELPNRLRIDFMGKEGDAREQLIKHLVQRQSALLGEERDD